MKDIRGGLARFSELRYPEMKNRFQQLSDGQQPDALFITCSDSRIEPALVCDCEPGHLFVIRNAGNIVGTKDNVDLGTVATIEYAVKALKVPTIIVCGHAKCGAMQGLMQPEAAAGLSYVGKWVAVAGEALKTASNVDGEDRLEQVVKANIRHQLNNLLTFDFVAEAVESGKLELSGWYYDFPVGEISILSPKSGKFVPHQELEINP